MGKKLLVFLGEETERQTDLAGSNPDDQFETGHNDADLLAEEKTDGADVLISQPDESNPSHECSAGNCLLVNNLCWSTK